MEESTMKYTRREVLAGIAVAGVGAAIFVRGSEFKRL